MPKQQSPIPPRKLAGILLFAVAAAAATAFFLRQPPATPPAPPAQPQATPSPAQSAAPSTRALQEELVGRWLRPDGGYVLDIVGATAGGKLQARYLNPSPINVARAEWQWAAPGVQVFVELRDVNYPGSTYTLKYLGASDRMTGTYFQAAQGMTFDVEFTRLK